MMAEHSEQKRIAQATATSNALLAYSFGGSEKSFDKFAEDIGLLKEGRDGATEQTENTAKNIEQSKRLLAQVFEEEE